MPETKKYAIRCSTEEQARECVIGRINIDIPIIGNNIYTEKEIIKKGYTIITYEEAVGLGILNHPKKADSGIREEVKEESKIEEISDKLHRMRAGRYVTQKYNMSDDNFERREKQAQTEYKDLSEEDKEKDRKFAREILDIINK